MYYVQMESTTLSRDTENREALIYLLAAMPLVGPGLLPGF
jgi:hypothetical protein